ncbi:MAG: Gfo/Idh/MocA family oxidoreductase, partial [Pedobacter sp.]
IASAGGVTGTALAKKYNFSNSTTDHKEILSDVDVDLAMITTRHDKHAQMVVEALNAGKHVFVEKPLALNAEQLKLIIDAYKSPLRMGSLTVGFNRRFSPHAVKVKKLIGTSTINVIATMNAGFLPENSWVHDMATGGGRIIGEACHFIDLISYFTGCKVKSVCMNAMENNPQANTDNGSILLKYTNGSTGVINYFSNGAKSYAKERVEIYSQERTAVINNFKITEGYGFKGFSKLRTGLDKGHKSQFKQLISMVKNGGAPLIPFDELINTTKASFAAIESLKSGGWVDVS